MPKRDERHARFSIKSNLKVALPAIAVAVLMAHPAAAKNHFARTHGSTYNAYSSSEVVNFTDYQRGGSN
jgi:hypothetical protein